MDRAGDRRFKTGMLALAIVTASTGHAQAAEDLEEIQVTGTRIRTTDGMVQPTPVTAVTTGATS